jgi:subtilisin family serine protease
MSVCDLLNIANSITSLGFNGGKRLKVAVLDTGIDLSHPKIRGQIVEHECFVEGGTIEDNSGHGTHIAGIILDLTVNIDLHVAKVTDSRSFLDRSPLVKVNFKVKSLNHRSDQYLGPFARAR